jgi:hypothetical protein
MSQLPLNIGFWQALVIGRWDVTFVLAARCLCLESHKLWSLHCQILYLDYMNDHTGFLQKYIWKMKVPLNIRILMWFLYPRVMLMKENLLKQKWQGSKKCCFCDQEEMVQHANPSWSMFFTLNHLGHSKWLYL